MAATAQQQQQQPPQPAPDDGGLSVQFGRMYFPERSAPASSITYKLENFAAVREIENRLGDRSELSRIIVTQLEDKARSAGEKAALDSAVGKVVDYLMTKSSSIVNEIRSLPTDVTMRLADEAAGKTIIRHLGEALTASTRPPAISADLTTLTNELAGDKAAKQEPVLIQKISQALAKGVIFSAPLPFHLITQEVPVAGGAVTFRFADRNGEDVVEILNHDTGVGAVFSASALTPAERDKFDEVLLRMGRDSHTRFNPANTHFNPDPISVPSLKGEIEREDLATIYERLIDVSKGDVIFEELRQPSRDQVLRPLKSICDINTDLTVTSSGVGDSATERAVLEAERTAAQSSPFDRAHNQLQLDHLSASASVICARTNANGSAAIQQIGLRAHAGEYFVELTTRNLGGAPALLSFKVSPENFDGDAGQMVARLGDIIENFSTESEKRLSDSETVKRLLAIGSIYTIAGLGTNGAKTEISDVTWLGQSLAPDAKLTNVKFTNAALDLSGKGATITNCEFKGCDVGFHARDIAFKDTSFDSGCILYGKLTGSFEGSSLRGNAFHLDIRELEFKDLETIKSRHERDKAVRGMFSGVILCQGRCPAAVLAVSMPYYSVSLTKENERISRLFDGDVFNTLIHQNNQNRETATFSTESSTINGIQVIDLYPRSFDRTGPGNPMVLRVFIDDEKKMSYQFAPKNQLAGSYEDAKKKEKANRDPNVSIVTGKGNVETFKATLAFNHMNFGDLAAPDPNDPNAAVTVSANAPAPVPGSPPPAP